jgi:1-acyl-sn-glycerol-3-phosphate acyltransferase
LIKADHKKWAEFIFNIYLKRLFIKSFHDFIIVNDPSDINKTKSLVITPNHFSWWDGFFVYWLNKKVLNKKLFIMMLEDQLKRYWFFQKIGCYSIDLEDNRKSITSLKYTMDLLAQPDNLVTLFPQGEIQPFEQRPLKIKNGINFLSQKSKQDFQILPIAFKIHYSSEKLPTIYARFGHLLNSESMSSDEQLFKYEFKNNIDLLDQEYQNAPTKSIF